MSESMLDDENQMNGWNPFVNERDLLLPGSVRRNGDFDDFDEVVTESTWGVPDAEPSPLCEVATTMGDRTVDYCKPAAPNCADNRSMHPKRYIDLGWTCKHPRGGAPKGPIQVVSPSPRNKLVVRPLVIFILTLLILFLLISRR
jgi:hypothetical protein